eukprot:scaffold34547_cov69-Cyclotella_meneghiniana.AAC.2
MAMDRSTIRPYFPLFLMTRPQFLRFWQACTAFIRSARLTGGIIRRDGYWHIADEKGNVVMYTSNAKD